MNNAAYQLARDRAQTEQLRHIADADLIRIVLGRDVSLAMPLSKLARASAHEVSAALGVSRTMAARLVTAFELGRRGAWARPRPGVRCLAPAIVAALMRDLALESNEEFHVVLLDVRGRLISRRMVARGGLTQCPVSPRDVLRPAVGEGAHGVVFVHNHPSGDASPSEEDQNLTERLRAAADLVGILARDHVIIGGDGYFSFVEAGRWPR